jgi:HSP20 family protein
MRMAPLRKQAELEVSRRPWQDLRTQMDRLFEKVFWDPWGADDYSLGSRGGTWVPSIDVSDHENEILIRAEVPGLDPKDVDISVTGDTLTLSGEKKDEREEKDTGYYHSERYYGSFRREIPLPAGCDLNQITAEYDKGVLTVRVAKDKTAAPRRIEIARREGEKKEKQQVKQEKTS